MQLHYATTNPGKVMSLQSELGKHGFIVVQVPMDIPEPRSSDVEEIACEKVRYAFGQLKRPVVALDAGFYISSLNGFPRAFVNFALETIQLDGILELVRAKERAAEFRHSLAYIDESLQQPVQFTDHVKGALAFEPRGTLQPFHWSELALIFVPEHSTKTLGEMTYEEYQAWRKVARDENSYSRQFVSWFRGRQPLG